MSTHESFAREEQIEGSTDLGFGLTVIPIGLLLRAFDKDPLHLKFVPESTGYWITRDPPGPSPESMPQQF